jgi:hypothetical protein
VTAILTLLLALRRQGVSIVQDGPNLVIDGPEAVLTDSLVASLRSIKGELTAALRPHAAAEWSAEDWQAYFDERAAVREYDGGQSRAEAEAGALEDTIERWLACHPAELTSASNGCVYCGRPEQPWNALLPIFTPGGGVWMHDQCWPAWYRSRRVHAREALLQAGLCVPEPPPTWSARG